MESGSSRSSRYVNNNEIEGEFISKIFLHIRLLISYYCYVQLRLGSPGRVVNLLEGDANDVVWGIAYEIEDSVWKNEIEKKLDHREKGGYNQNITKFYPKKGTDNDVKCDSFDVIAYIGKVTDDQYAGAAPLEEMAKTILESVGPSGPNKEYLYNLAHALKELGIEDEHVSELDKAVKQMEATESGS